LLFELPLVEPPDAAVELLPISPDVPLAPPLPLAPVVLPDPVVDEPEPRLPLESVSELPAMPPEPPSVLDPDEPVPLDWPPLEDDPLELPIGEPPERARLLRHELNSSENFS